MKHFVLLTLLSIASLCPSMANVVCQKAGPHNMHIRVEGDYRYLLLPIGDKAHEYRVQLIEDNQLHRSLIIRLANEGEIDYYVPLDLQGLNLDALHLNVRYGNEPIAWDKIQAVNSYDASNTDKYGPVFHHTPQWGWMNDPNGMFYDEQKELWHLYYQYNPYASTWQNMTWGTPPLRTCSTGIISHTP